MGIEPFLMASSLVGVVGQRLVRKICPSCVSDLRADGRRSTSCTTSSAARTKDTFVHGVGCNYCSDTGYRDRVGVYEVLAVTDEIRQLIITSAPPQELRALAVAQGMRTMSHEAMALVAADVTTIDEVIHNVYVN